MMKKLLVEVGELTDKEYARANEQYPAFASDHEGLAVAEEEVAETIEAIGHVQELAYALRKAVRANDYKETTKVSELLYTAAQDVAAEAIQTAAMAEKLIESQDIRKTKKWPALPMLGGGRE